MNALQLQVIGILAIFTFVAGEVITFKPFVRSRYSLRKRTRTTTPTTKDTENLRTENPELKRLNLNYHQMTTSYLHTAAPVDVGVQDSKNWDSKVNKNTLEHTTARLILVPTAPTKIEGETEPTVTIAANRIFVATTNRLNNSTSQTDWSYDYYGAGGSEDEDRK